MGLSKRAQKRIDRILVYGGVAATVALLGGVLLFGDPAQESASPTSTASTSTTTTMPIPDASDTTTSTLPESGGIIDLTTVLRIESPDFDQIAETDGSIEACRAWAEWNHHYDQTVSCEVGGGEYRVSEMDIDCPVQAALDDMADCVTVGWANLDVYLRCIDAARVTTTTTTEPGIIDRTHRIFILSAEDRARCRTAAISDGE